MKKMKINVWHNSRNGNNNNNKKRTNGNGNSVLLDSLKPQDEMRKGTTRANKKSTHLSS
jgi:hypothetical protein